ncbi:YbgC/FadM family acyl-CoA thioesterase [Tanticharoenia sakaeratensis]|jgi:tol-pal system-associated acyl-CoA thioesterase|uniref:Uncharacterized protein n=1 Tax=Tanticharoenia sakaeratensis NBRC 103193 TaxID=1231623 RepID=A0A0D6MIH3_9PROT|nr:YbgC/FadM family acyl-CoA thioesterase [Tanticharoenia sakaeratensis]GAN53083.1 hypothetical protein Tasa_004_148 [Tanticharoenia sakaeratensis NBRC 103193]GBQ19566.1 4-hydroxybenzoyl-CoA thioesterase [Tanticharoenia sakaeratensis NBRC 103193]
MHSAVYRVYYEDTDAFGIMYHARHIAFAERARADAMRDAGGSVSTLAAEHGLGFVVRRLSVAYRASLKLDDAVRVTTALRHLRGASCALEQVLWRDDIQAAVLAVDLACVTLGDARPARIPPRWCGVLETLRDVDQA